MAFALGLTLLYMIVEIVGGIASGSLALLADAGHMLADAGALALALFAMWIARRPATAQRTYGYLRTEILAALANGAALAVIAVSIFIEAIQRFATPTAIAGPMMLGVAAGGLVMNVIALAILGQGRHESLNVHGAWLHVVSDALGSVGAIISGALVWGFGFTWADSLASVVIAALVIRSAWGLLKEAVAVLMENAPGHLDVDEVRKALAAYPEVSGVHDLHVWTITSGLVCLSAHVVTGSSAETQSGLLAGLTRLLRDRFHIAHVTLQVEHANFSADDCSHCE
ncbi:MAG: cation transporter [Myxococcales bacterium]|nr:cation transporter [Myxococcales bacterium]